jgi:hypothetical protein
MSLSLSENTDKAAALWAVRGFISEAYKRFVHVSAQANL